jgi:hypothetical protein
VRPGKQVDQIEKPGLLKRPQTSERVKTLPSCGKRLLKKCQSNSYLSGERKMTDD